MRTLTPFGVSELLPQELKKRDTIIASFKTIFEKYNYNSIVTPTIEYYETLEKGLPESLKARSITFFNDEGQLMVLRPDHTTPIARTVATRMTTMSLPLRLYYVDSVFRKSAHEKESQKECFQIGVETFGDTSIRSEVDVLSLCIETLLSVGVDFGIEIGHTCFSDALSAEKKEALIQGDYVSYGALPERGGEEIIASNPELSELCTQLKEKKLDQYVSFNSGMVKDLDYYSGIIFECYIKGFGYPIGSGGRYDALSGKFGWDIPAVGFGIDLTLLQRYLDRDD